MSGEAFEFTPAGVQPLSSPTATAGTINAADAVAALREQVARQDAARSLQAASKAAPAASAKPLSRRSFVRDLRDRLAQVRRELKTKRLLESEEAELVRLIAAAKQPPARVTPITSARKSG
jgi:hypothetical protein